MPVPEFTPFTGLLPSEGDPATFPPRAQALFEWFTVTGAPQFANISTGIEYALEEMQEVYTQTGIALVNANAAHSGSELARIGAETARSGAETARQQSQEAQAKAEAAAANSQTFAKYADSWSGPGLQAINMTGDYPWQVIEIGPEDGPGAKRLQATASGYDGAQIACMGAGVWHADWSRWIWVNRPTMWGLRAGIDGKVDKTVIDAQGALPEYRFSDRKGWRLGKLTADVLRTKFFEVGQDRLRAGGMAAEITTRRGLNLRDAKGYFYRPIGMRDIFKTSTRSGAYLRDKKGRTIRIDNQAIPVPDIPEIPEAYVPLASSGAGMFAARAKLAALAQGASGVTSRIVLTGDSWIERDTIADPFSAVLHDKYGRGADGFISLSQTIGEPGSVGLALSGFTVNDVTAQRGAPKAYYGPSGDYIEATGTAATARISGLKCETLNIYYWDGDGTFRYRIDGGAWSDVVGGNTGAPAKVSVSGLDGANHLLEIDLASNTGTVRLTNLYATGMDGVEVSKIGNAEARATDFALFIDNAMSAFVLADIAPQAVCICLGTNDVSANVGLTAFRNGLAGIAAAYRAAYANCGAVLAVAPQSSRTGAQTNAGYHATSVETASATDLVEYIDLVSLFGPYAARTTPGVWQDDSHLNTSGGRLWASHIINTFFNIT